MHGQTPKGRATIVKTVHHQTKGWTSTHMRSSKSRSRSKSNRNRSVGNVVNRVFDSSGPEGKVRGTPQQIIDKYNQLARDSQLAGDRVATENFQQHAEHYLRMLAEAMKEQAERQAQQQERQRNNQQNQQNKNNNQNQGGQQNNPQGNGQNNAQAGDGPQPREERKSPPPAEAPSADVIEVKRAKALWLKRPRTRPRASVAGSPNPSLCGKPRHLPPRLPRQANHLRTLPSSYVFLRISDSLQKPRSTGTVSARSVG